MINIGKYIEIAINWLTEHFARFFDVINDGVGGFIDAFQDGLTWIPFYVMILGLALLAWFKAGKGVGIGSIVNLRNGFLGGNDADFGLGTVFYHHRLDDRSSVRNLDRTQ